MPTGTLRICLDQITEEFLAGGHWECRACGEYVYFVDIQRHECDRDDLEWVQTHIPPSMIV